ncbi:MAG TPA: hypothetical protein VLI05_06805 [Candidatus Saccharimonadia bacterium]|nr:hypothetical protein [Candidatus Saccharimonadia bacterium]
MRTWKRMVYFVGSIPAASSEAARRLVFGRFGSQLLALTDGETDESYELANGRRARKGSKWIVGDLLNLREDSPALEVAELASRTTTFGNVQYDTMPTYRKRPGWGRRLTADDIPLSIADAARAGYAEHQRLCPEVLYQVGIPALLNYLLFTFGLKRAFRPQYFLAMLGAVKREMRLMFEDDPVKGLKGLPVYDVLVQIEDPGGFCILTAVPPELTRLKWLMSWRPVRWLTAQLVAVLVWWQVRWLPKRANVATHACLGDLEHTPYGRLSVPAVALYHNALVHWRFIKGRSRTWAVSHLPLATGQDFPPENGMAYGPLRHLRFPPDLYVAFGTVVSERRVPGSDMAEQFSDERAQGVARLLLDLVPERVRRYIIFAMPCGGGRCTESEFEGAMRQIELLAMMM